MDLSNDERLLLGYLSEFCPTPDKAGALAVGINWEHPRGVNESHTESLKGKFAQNWDRFNAVIDGLKDKGLVSLHQRKSILDCWVTPAGRSVIATSDPLPDGDHPGSHSSLWERVMAVVMGSIGVMLIAFVIIRNEPFRDLNIVIVFRGLVALSFAVSAATVPGFLNIGWSGAWGYGRAGGALAVFVLSLIYTPTVLKNPVEVYIPPPEAFVYQTCLDCADPRLPNDSLGRADDNQKSPRQWMWSAQDNADKQIPNCVHLWLLTDRFASDYQEFVAHVNVAVAKDALVSCHLLQPKGAIKRVELSKAKSTSKDEVIHYFSVPSSHEGDRILVFVAMPKASYQTIHHDPKFKISKN